MGDPQLSGNHAGPYPVMSHLHDFMTDVVGQRSAVDKNPTELVHPALTQRGGNWRGAEGKSVKQKKGKKLKTHQNGEHPSPHLQLLAIYLVFLKERRSLSPKPWPRYLSLHHREDFSHR